MLLSVAMETDWVRALLWKQCSCSSPPTATLPTPSSQPAPRKHIFECKTHNYEHIATHSTPECMFLWYISCEYNRYCVCFYWNLTDRYISVQMCKKLHWQYCSQLTVRPKLNWDRGDHLLVNITGCIVPYIPNFTKHSGSSKLRVFPTYWTYRWRVMTVWQWGSMYNSETEAAKWNPAIIHFIFYTCAIHTVAWQNVCHKNGLWGRGQVVYLLFLPHSPFAIWVQSIQIWVN